MPEWREGACLRLRVGPAACHWSYKQYVHEWSDPPTTEYKTKRSPTLFPLPVPRELPLLFFLSLATAPGWLFCFKQTPTPVRARAPANSGDHLTPTESGTER